MPTYDYQCNSCQYRFEKYQPITSKSIRKCPKCGRLKVQRLLGTGGGILFKGSGFYQTDYRSKGYQEAAKKETGTKDGSKETPKDTAKDSSKSSSDKAPDKPASGKK